MKKLHLTGLCVLLLSVFVTGCDNPKTPTSMGSPPPSSSASSGGGSSTPVVLDSLLTRRNFFVVFDGSGSMTSGGKIDTAKRAVIEFAQSLKPEDNLGLVAFDNSGTSERVLLGTDNRDNFSQAINAVSANGGTPLYKSIEFAFDRLREQMGKQLDYGEYHIVVVTDGEASDRSEGDLVGRINQTPVVLHTIGFDIGEGHSLNQPGKTDYSSAQNPEELRKSLRDVLAESEEFGK